MNSLDKTKDGMEQIWICQNNLVDFERYEEFCVELGKSVGGSLGLQQIRL